MSAMLTQICTVVWCFINLWTISFLFPDIYIYIYFFVLQLVNLGWLAQDWEKRRDWNKQMNLYGAPNLSLSSWDPLIGKGPEQTNCYPSMMWNLSSLTTSKIETPSTSYPSLPCILTKYKLMDLDLELNKIEVWSPTL
jgi:hypothetical protein